MTILYRVPESPQPRKGYVLKVYSCGHRFLVRELCDGSTRLVDLAELVGTKELKKRS